MQNAAVICEYNPFHNGHRYQLEFIKNELGADHVTAIMSGNFVQRGEPALLDKYTRTKLALLNGADLVLEIPPVFSTASAAEYAAAGVGIAFKSGIVDTLCFGTEGNASLPELSEYSGLMRAAADDKFVKELLKNGATYPEAVGFFLEKKLKTAASDTFAAADAVRSKSEPAGNFCSDVFLPNNILAASYIYALKHKELFGCDSLPDIAPHPIKRIGAGYSDERLTEVYASASAVRKYVHDFYGERSRDTSCISHLSDYVPSETLSALEAALSDNSLVFPDDMSSLLSMRLLDTAISLKYPSSAAYGIYSEQSRHSGGHSLRGSDLTDYLDVSREISDRLLNNADRIMSFKERVLHTKTRQYTYSRISRALLHIILKITVAEFKEKRQNGYIDYIRILGFRRDAADSGLLKKLKKNSRVPVITKPANYKVLLRHDIYCDQIYWSLKNKTGEYERSPVII